jgi:hypothetical protein
MKISKPKVNKFLYFAQAVGALFAVFFLTAYLGGLPGTAVLHSELLLRVPLAILGAVLVFLVLLPALVIAALREKE